MAGPPIRDGAVLIGGDGRIVAVGPDAAVPRPEGVPGTALERAALVPGLVNTHTHLELSGLGGQVEDDAFADWITRLRGLKATRTPERFLEAARAGVRDCWAAGVTTVADTGDTGTVIRALHEMGGSGICYQEVFGPHPDQRDAGMSFLRQRVTELMPLTTPRLRLGVSPHAPYSVSGPLYAAVADFAATEGLPIAVHLAESQAETDLVTRGEGPFAEFWSRRAIPVPASHPSDRFDEARIRSPVAWLDHHGVLGPGTLAIHVIRVDAADVAILAARGVAVAHCPLSNRRHGHGDAPLAALLQAGVVVGVGTDSVASIPRLDLMAETRAARILGALDAESALALCTRDAAAALGMQGEVGQLVRGAWGDVTALALRDDAPSDLYEAVLGAGVGDTLVTWLAGREVFRRGGPRH
jgi:cytosine/adenosine deaminase-related metal-dependent hydrolase